MIVGAIIALDPHAAHVGIHQLFYYRGHKVLFQP